MSKSLKLSRAVANLLCEDDSTVRELQPLKSALSVTQYPHAKRFVQDATRAFGEDSTIARVAKFGERTWDDLLAMQGIDSQGILSYWASAKGIAALKKEEGRLLEWAESFDSVPENM